MAVWESAVEDLVMNRTFWNGKNVLITGHTGFKGGWLAYWLQSSGANVAGYSLAPPTDPNLFSILALDKALDSRIGDVRDLDTLAHHVKEKQPEIIFHLAAQPLVRYSYENPVETYSTNIMGTVNILEAVRSMGKTRVVVIVTSDKCYENTGQVQGYTEDDAMGGYDPYASSKGCAELVTSAYNRSFFNTMEETSIASVRAGNVIGGGDWAGDRLIPDIMRSLIAGAELEIRNPGSVRPWQHVLDPLNGYMVLAEKLWDKGGEYSGGWNFGPADDDTKPVSWILNQIRAQWDEKIDCKTGNATGPHEAKYLKLDCTKARELLNWKPMLSLSDSIRLTVDWYRAYKDGEDLISLTNSQIKSFFSSCQ